MIKRGVFGLWILLLFWSGFSFAATTWKPISTNNVANLLSSWSKSVLNYENNRYDISSHKFSTDLFWDNASNYKIKSWWKILNWLDAVKWVLQSSYTNCSLEDNEILWVLFYTNGSLGLKDEIMKSVPSNRWPTVKDQKKWCDKLTTCIAWELDKNMNRSCDEIVRNAYILWVNEKTRKYLLEEANLWTEKYYNGTLDDSSYDILYDIQQIAKVLYEDPKTVTSVLFYQVPSFNWSKWGSSIVGNGQWWGQGASNQTNSSSSSTTRTSQGGEWGAWGEWGDNWDGGSNNWWNNWGGNWGGGNDWSSPSISDDEEILNFLNNDGENRTITSNWNTAFVNQCVVVWSTVLEEAYLEAEEEAENYPERTPNELSDEEIEAIYDDILKNANELKQISPNTPLTWQENDPTSNKVSRWVTWDAATVATLKKELESCVSRCDWLRVDEKAVCRALCLCAEYQSPALNKNMTYKFIEEWALRVRICNIPSQAKIVSTSTKNVYSIEAILLEIHDTLKALLESWELTPKVQKEEMLDTSLSDMKIWNMISLILNMKFSQPTDERWKSEDDKREENEAIEASRIDIKWNPDIFVVVWASDENQSMSSSKAPQVIASADRNGVAIKENQVAGINNMVSNFILDNYTFLTTLNDALYWMMISLSGIPKTQ